MKEPEVRCRRSARHGVARPRRRREVRWRWAVLLVFLISDFGFLTSGFAADHCIRSGQSGDGSAWNNAFGSLPATLTRGDTYYIADGSSGGYTIDDAVSGTTLITIKKATVASHGPATGWDNTYGDGVATFSGTVNIKTNYVVFDGVTGGGPGSWTSGYGFKINVTSSGSGQGMVIGAITAPPSANHVTVSHVEIQGNGGDGVQPLTNDGFFLDKTAQDVLINYCYIHDMGRTIFMISSNPPANVVVDRCYTGRFESGNEHAEIASVLPHWSYQYPTSAVTFSNNVFTYIIATGGLMLNVTSAQVYGNIFFRPAGTCFGGQAAVGGWSNSIHNNVKVYNNTFIDLTNPGSCDVNTYAAGTTPISFPGGTGNESKNNLFYNSPASNGMGTASHNHFNNSGSTQGSNATTGTGNPFVDFVNLDFRLLSNTTAGSNVGAPYNVDMLGNTRTTWTRGAIEFAGVPEPTPTPTPTPPIISVSTNLVNFGSVIEDAAPADKTLQVKNVGDGTLNGTATVSGSGVISLQGSATYNLAANEEQTVTVRYRPTTKANDAEVITFTGAGGTSASVSGTCYPLMPGLTFAANAGVITMPFVDNVGAVSQTVDTQNAPEGSNPVPWGGRVSYGITIATAGEYRVDAEVDAPDPGHNSFFINIGGEPSDPDKIWDVTQLTDGLELRSANWRGTGTFDNPQYMPKVFTLSQGVHELVIRGREPDTILGGDITIVPLLPVAASPTFDPDGGSYTTSQDVTLSTTTAGATIKYTTDGAQFNSGQAPPPSAQTYGTPIPLNYIATIRAITEKAGMSDSPQATSNPYEIKVATPTISPNGGTHDGDVTVTLATTTPDCALYYTTDGSEPTPPIGPAAGSTPYGVPFVVNASCTVKTMARKIGLKNNTVASAEFTITTPSPTPTPTPTATPTPTPTPTITPTVTPPPLLPLTARIIR